MTESPTVVTSNSTKVDSSTLSTPIQCCSETEVPPAAMELVTITHKMIRNDGQSELVIGKEFFVPFHFLDSIILGT